MLIDDSSVIILTHNKCDEVWIGGIEWLLELIGFLAGSVLSGGGSVPGPKASAVSWVNMVNGIQKASLSTRLGIPMIYGIDAVHGHNNVYNATIFPHNVGLGVTRQVDESTNTAYLYMESVLLVVFVVCMISPL